MKLRIHRNSLRFRLSREEVEALARGEGLGDSVAVGPLASQQLAYRIVPDPDAPAEAPMKAEFAGNALSVLVPLAGLRRWHEDSRLELAGAQAWPGGAVRLLLEKDLQRLDAKPAEAEGEVYPHPGFSKVRGERP